MIKKVIYDLEDFPLKKNDGGLYAILPYEKLDKNNKALFKVGYADSFEKRFEQYHTYYPFGFYYKNLLATPTKKKNEQTKKQYYGNIEKSIFHNIQNNGGKVLKTTTRTKKNYTKEHGGDSEWFYTNEKTLDNAFNDAFKNYGGKNLNTHLTDINNEAKKNKKKSTYTGEIHYKIPKK